MTSEEDGMKKQKEEEEEIIKTSRDMVFRIKMICPVREMVGGKVVFMWATGKVVVGSQRGH